MPEIGEGTIDILKVFDPITLLYTETLFKSREWYTIFISTSWERRYQRSLRKWTRMYMGKSAVLRRLLRKH